MNEKASMESVIRECRSLHAQHGPLSVPALMVAIQRRLGLVVTFAMVEEAAWIGRR